jgi:anti-anti-sigma factor
MNLTVRADATTAVIAIDGEFLGALHRPALRTEVDALRERGIVRVVLDLRSTTLMDSAGLGALIEVATGLRTSGGDLRLAVRSGRLKRLFEMTGLLGRVFAVFPTPAEALASWRDGPAVSAEA